MILSCGEAVIDMIPEKGVSGADCFQPKTGGALFNTSLALGRLGADVALLTGVSNDLFGQMLVDDLTASNVGVQHLVRSDAPTTLAFVKLVDGHATYTFYTNGAADTLVTPRDCPDDSTPIDALLFGGISLCNDPTASTMLDLMQRRAASSVLMLDPNIRPAFISDETSYRARIQAMAQQSDILKISDDDLDWLVPDTADPVDQIKTMIGERDTLVLLTRGSKGARAYQRGAMIAEVPAVTATVVDTVGAGDTFNAGILHSLSTQGCLTKAFCANPTISELDRAMTFAAQIAAIVVARTGANPPWASEL